MNIIEFKNVSKTYDSGTHALNNASLNIEKGEFVFIVGASGAGKSTFLKLIMHEEAPTRGTIIVNGTNVTTIKRRKVPYLRRDMGIVFQDFRLIEKMSVYDNVAFAMRAIGASPSAVKKRVPYILDLVGLAHKAKNRPSELSGGEQQRVSLARALVNNPAIIIADEPTGNIDPEMSYEIIQLLNKINSQGTTILVVTHEHELVRQFNKRVIEIDKGKVISDTKEPVIVDEEIEFDDSRFELEPADKELQEVIDELSERELNKIVADDSNVETKIDEVIASFQEFTDSVVNAEEGSDENNAEENSVEISGETEKKEEV